MYGLQIINVFKKVFNNIYTDFPYYKCSNIDKKVLLFSTAF